MEDIEYVVSKAIATGNPSPPPPPPKFPVTSA